MKEVFSDFMLIERLPDGQERVRIPRRQIEQASVQAGDEVTLIEYDNLRAKARIEYENGHWYGLILGAVEDINPSTRSVEPTMSGV
jgi:hypothetical protein